MLKINIKIGMIFIDKVLGIIAEYNPFHNGHLYQLNKAKKETNCEYSIAIISGNFTQRGLPSIFNKWDKTKLALLGGVDLVIELPLPYSISSAENFADGAIKILNSLNIIDYLSFGVESSNFEMLNLIADVLLDEPSDFKSLLSIELSKGLSFPKARANALTEFLHLNNSSILEFISSPNNILGIEYLKALKKYNSNISTYPVLRLKSDYNEKKINSDIASSTAIREALLNHKYSEIKNVVPKNCFDFLMQKITNNEMVLNLSAFEKQILYRLRMMSIEEIADLPDVSEGLEFSLKSASISCNSLSSLIESVKSKRYTYTRIQRILLYVLLNITKHDMVLSKNIMPYIRILGFNEKGKFLVSKISSLNPNLKVITSVKKFIDNCDDSDLKFLLEKDICATNIYAMGYGNNKVTSQLDYTNNIVII